MIFPAASGFSWFFHCHDDRSATGTIHTERPFLPAACHMGPRSDSLWQNGKTQIDRQVGTIISKMLGTQSALLGAS